ncbi:MAG: type I-G CRISPR-associated helicase/endonuclease Cas3g, partial [Stackebrandtia sp.]
MALTADDFARFYQELYPARDGEAKPREPFPWQQALVGRVLRDGWPDAIDIPTGLGKTSVLDVAVFCAAVKRDLAPRRMFFVVDRRLIVDAAWEHARNIAATLALAESDSVCHAIAQALRQDGDVGPVLSVTRMRGGVTWDGTWLDRPDRFAIVTGTVDQIGSRMLFRGYGVAEYARPIDAALTGTDSLVLIDEAHLSEPFRRTISDAATFEPAQIRPAPT